MHWSNYSVFQNDRFIFLKLTFTVIKPSLLFLLVKKDEAFHFIGMKGKLLPTHLDSSFLSTMAQKSQLKNQVIPPSRLDCGAYVDAAKGNSQTSQPHRALLWPTASTTFDLGYRIYTFLALIFNICFKWKRTKTEFWKDIPTYKAKGIFSFKARTDSQRSHHAAEFGQPDKEAVAGHFPATCSHARLLLPKPVPTKRLLSPFSHQHLKLLYNSFFGVQLHLWVLSA